VSLDEALLRSGLTLIGSADSGRISWAKWPQWCFWGCLGLTIAVTAIRNPINEASPPQVAPSIFLSEGIVDATPVFESSAMGTVAAAPHVHASTVTRLSGERLLAAWFGGSREGASDVAIYLSRWEPSSGAWGEPYPLIDRASASRELGRYVKKLGNPVLHRDPRGRVWLYFVTVSTGGWSGSSVSLKWSDDEGASWSEARRLITSPFMNISTLVRCPPIDLADGGVLLPLHHELLMKFGELARLDPQGNLVERYRMNCEASTLQPSLLATPEGGLVAFYRRGSGEAPYVHANRSEDGGVTWTPAEPIDLPNPDASVCVVRRHGAPGGALMAFNPSSKDRKTLALAVSQGDRGWRIVHTFEGSGEGKELSYPTLIRGRQGEYHLTHTEGRTRIRHVRFNEAWLEGR
jgi:predicted neuraminidase